MLIQLLASAAVPVASDRTVALILEPLVVESNHSLPQSDLSANHLTIWLALALLLQVQLRLYKGLMSFRVNPLLEYR